MTTISERSEGPSGSRPDSKWSGAAHLGLLFAATAEAFADRPAVSAPDGGLTYHDLARASDGLAGRLSALGAGPETVIGLYLSRSTQMVVGVVGIVKSGGAYLPIDPSAPAERLRWLLADSGAGIVVTESALADRLDGYAGAVVVLDGPDRAPSVPVTSPRHGKDLCYVIYTSGSTGTPKGVMVEHHSVVRLFESTQHWYGFDEHDTWAMFHSIAFDFSVWEMWGALLHGGHLVVVSHDTARSPADLLTLLADARVTVLNQTPSAFRQLMAAEATSMADLPALRLVIFGGERLDIASIGPWIARRGDLVPQLVNMYGITEATVHASYRRIRATDLSAPEISPIGEPLPDLGFVVVDPTGAPVGPGGAGELCISGPGVARGYLGRAELTAERFVVPGSGDSAGARRLRTGDLVRGDGEGGYVYIGRDDDQIKVRGYRIEPREVEVILERHPLVDASVLRAWDFGDGDTRLVAYLVPSVGVAGDVERWRALQAELAATVTEVLPRHMCPSAYVVLAALPVTTNGKVDRAALPRPPPLCSSRLGDGFTPTQSAIATVWREVMGVDVTSPEDDFFDLGGTSLALVRMFTHVNILFGTDLEITVLLDGATVGNLAASVQTALDARN